MGLHKYKPLPSGRMGILWTLSTIREAALIEFGCMGHMLYARVFLNRTGAANACKLYSTHIDETDIALGGIERIRKTIAEVIAKDKPRVIFMIPSSVLEIIGTDLFAICQEIQPDFPEARLIPFAFGGFQVSMHKGVEETLLRLARVLPVKRERTEKPTYNIIGSCADLYRFQEDAGEIVRLLKGTFNMEPLCIMTSDTSLRDMEQMGGAHFNIVIRREGKPCARHLEETFGTPYFCGRPYGIQGTKEWLLNIGEKTGLSIDKDFVEHETAYAMERLTPVLPYFRHIGRMHPDEAVISLGGHADVVKGILTFAGRELFFSKGICWCDCPDMHSEDLPYYTEKEWEPAVKSIDKGILMGSGEVVKLAGSSRNMQIANPDDKWNLYSFGPPFVGFRGAVYLAELWINENINIH